MRGCHPARSDIGTREITSPVPLPLPWWRASSSLAWCSPRSLPAAPCVTPAHRRLNNGAARPAKPSLERLGCGVGNRVRIRCVIHERVNGHRLPVQCGLANTASMVAPQLRVSRPRIRDIPSNSCLPIRCRACGHRSWSGAAVGAQPGVHQPVCQAMVGDRTPGSRPAWPAGPR